MLKNKRILLVVSGGVAAYKALELVRQIRSCDGLVRCILTKSGSNFVTPLSLQALSENQVYSDLFSLTDESEMGHIRLSREADLIVVAPATANFLAKMKSGICDDLASTVLLATDKPVLVAPSMNVRMWEHPATMENMLVLKSQGINVVGPNQGPMACSETGWGRMAEPMEIINAINSLINFEGPLAGKKALVTAGPTWEPIDPVRYITNRSSGKQGYAIATALSAAGADTTLVTGPTNIPRPIGVRIIETETAEEMLNCCMDALPTHVAVCAAAVADWKVAHRSVQKIKKNPNNEEPTIELNQNPDILKTLCAAGSNRPSLVVGFAAETNNVIQNGIEKLRSKGCDWILANDVSAGTGTFGGDNNSIHFISSGEPEEWPSMPKECVAEKLAKKIASEIGT